MSEALKPCPFCGSENVKAGGDDKVVGVWCQNCQASGPNGYLTINGDHDWNTRTDMIAEAVEAAYERCAQVAEDSARLTRDEIDDASSREVLENIGNVTSSLKAHSIAKAIRALGEKADG